jgi:hypothetical protein
MSSRIETTGPPITPRLNVGQSDPIPMGLEARYPDAKKDFQQTIADDILFEFINQDDAEASPSDEYLEVAESQPSNEPRIAETNRRAHIVNCISTPMQAAQDTHIELWQGDSTKIVVECEYGNCARMQGSPEVEGILWETESRASAASTRLPPIPSQTAIPDITCPSTTNNRLSSEKNVPPPIHTEISTSRNIHASSVFSSSASFVNPSFIVSPQTSSISPSSGRMSFLSQSTRFVLNNTYTCDIR